MPKASKTQPCLIHKLGLEVVIAPYSRARAYCIIPSMETHDDYPHHYDLSTGDRKDNQLQTGMGGKLINRAAIEITFLDTSNSLRGTSNNMQPCPIGQSAHTPIMCRRLSRNSITVSQVSKCPLISFWQTAERSHPLMWWELYLCSLHPGICGKLLEGSADFLQQILTEICFSLVLCLLLMALFARLPIWSPHVTVTLVSWW